MWLTAIYPIKHARGIALPGDVFEGEAVLIASGLATASLVAPPPAPVDTGLSITTGQISDAGAGGIELLKMGPMAEIKSVVSGYGSVLRMRQIVSRTATRDTYSTSYKEAAGHKDLPVFSRVPSFRLVVTSQAVQGSNPQFGPATPSTFELACEFPPGSGSRVRVTFSGSNSGTETVGAFLTSDPVNLAINPSAKLRIYAKEVNATGLTYIVSGAAWLPTDGNAIGGVGSQSGYNVMTSTTGIASGYIAHPVVAVIADSYVPACMVAGDSLARGQQDQASVDGFAGAVHRTVGPNTPSINMGVSGSKMLDWNNAHMQGMFAGLFSYCDIAAWQIGTNDIYLGAQTDTQLRASMVAVMAKTNARTAGMRNYFNTVPPQTTSTDSWATAANQTIKAQEPYRIAHNRGLFAQSSIVNHANFGGALDVTPAVETGYESGLWIPGGTLDGTHMVAQTYGRVWSMGLVAPVLRQTWFR